MDRENCGKACGELLRISGERWITQEWRELPMWIRRPARYCITTSKLFSNIFKTVVGDAENLTFDRDEGEYICPPIQYLYYKRNKKVANLYDTYESINQL